MPRCRTCEAEIIWAASATTGKPMPMDAAPNPAGAFVIVTGKARKATVEDDRLRRERYTCHFATCPDADQHRRAG